jgi:hypothetical protein
VKYILNSNRPRFKGFGPSYSQRIKSNKDQILEVYNSTDPLEIKLLIDENKA